MNGDKQIEEMARDINIADHEYCNGKCVGCEHKPMRIENCACVDIAIAKGLVNAGYRKASDVAREIGAILSGYNAGNYAEVTLLNKLYELKKKCESEGASNESIQVHRSPHSL